FKIASGDDGFHADSALKISNGAIDITSSYEGLEGQTVDISGGNISLVSSDDGINAAGGNDSSGFEGNMMRDKFSDTQSDSYINISGGTLNITAGGDGVDSNGSITVSGGETYVSGPENSGNGSLDCGTGATITGGIFIAAGSSGMAENFGSDSTQGAILYTLSSQSQSEITLKDSSGAEIISFTPNTKYNCVIISCPEIKKGETYTLTAADTQNEIEMTDTLFSNGAGGSGGFAGKSGMRGQGSRGEMPPQGGAPQANGTV
ncbi:MAG: carbohydrate-binding domain-containing protein, partial [Acutalibacteraceae bacterium]